MHRNCFTHDEDRKLLFWIEKLNYNWKKIALEMKDRSVRQCKERYYHYLSPSIKKGKWSNEEDELLFSAIEKHGKRWKIIERMFDGRTEIDIRNRYNVLMRKKKKENSQMLLMQKDKEKQIEEFDFINDVENFSNDLSDYEFDTLTNQSYYDLIDYFS